MRKAIITGLVSVSLLTANSFAEFDDVKVSDWYYSAVNYVKESNIFSGTSENMFEPKNNMTRAMLVQVIFNMAGKPTCEKAIMDDVEAGKWYENAISWAITNNIASGIGENKFAPNNLITKEELITVLYNYAKYKGYDVSVGEDTNILSYEDAFELAEYAYEPMQWACGAGIIVGDSGRLNHNKPVTRAEVACIMKNFSIKYMKKEISIKLEGNPTTGYVWEAYEYDKNVVFVDDYTYMSNSMDKNLVGSSGIFNFSIVALNPGNTNIIFKYKRSFENNAINTVICKVDVNESGEIFVSQRIPEDVKSTTIKSHAFDEDMRDSVAKIIESKREFDLYVAEHGIINDLLYVDNKYDEKYFETNKLVAITRLENGGSIKNQVGETIKVNDNTLLVNITRIVPEATTLDIVTWHMFVDLPLEKYSNIDKIITNVNIK